ncbi:MAG: fliN [Geminicoccaceae bacterium]|jgi:flagellar motor switch protein FliN/FliY|nr:fliN [Geminicoccaceae bacterium]MCE3247616.1 fliN [Geminicoccaceae bacterium]
MSDETDKLDLNDLAATGTSPKGDHELARRSNPAPSLPAEAPARSPGGRSDDLGAVYDIPVQLSAVLGKATMPVSQLLRLGRGAVVELDRKVGESIDILVNNRLVARGEVVIVDDRLASP